MFTFNPPKHGAFRRIFERIALITFTLCLVLFMGCTMDNGEEFIDDGRLKAALIGTWDGDFDSYIITGNHLSYVSFFGPFAGEIVHVTNFNQTSGVIIIEYDADAKQEWPSGYDPETWEPTDYHDTTGLDFYGIYFRELSSNSVIISNTSDQKNDWGPSETATLPEAINRFRLHNMSDWIDLGTGTTPHSKVQP